MRRYRIKSFVMASGERYRLLVHKESGIPLFFPNLFVTTQVRNRSLSVAAMDSALAGINVLMAFCEERNIDLQSRFQSLKFLTIQEIDAIHDYCQKSFAKEIQDQSAQRTPTGLRDKPRKTKSIGLASEYMRLTHIGKYVKWLAEILLSSSMNRQTALDISGMKTGLESRRPVKKGRNQEGREKGLSEGQLDALAGVTRLGSEANPFNSPGVQIRNQLIVLLLLHLGIRGGELLNIRITDIDWSINQIVIARRADEKADPRVDQPNVKTLDRRLPVKDTLINALHRYVVECRNKIPGARKHNYLFVTHKSGPTQGHPISRSAYMKIIKLVADSMPELHGFRGHHLRHSWNHSFSEYVDQLADPPSPEEQEKQRSYLQGWKEGSGTASKYTKRFTKAKAMEAGLKLQDGITRVPESLNDQKN